MKKVYIGRGGMKGCDRLAFNIFCLRSWGEASAEAGVEAGEFVNFGITEIWWVYDLAMRGRCRGVVLV